MNFQNFLNEGKFPRSKEPVELMQMYSEAEINGLIPEETVQDFLTRTQLFMERKLEQLNDNDNPYWIWVSLFFGD